MWKDIKGFEGQYEMSDDRQVRSKPKTIVQLDARGKEYKRSFKSKVLNQWVDKEGYLAVWLGKSTYRIHWLYYNSFIGDSTGFYVDHIDRNKLNNDKSNLRLLTPEKSSLNRELPYKPDITKKKNKYQLRFSEKGRRKSIGYFNTYEEAEEKYRELFNKRKKEIENGTYIN